MYRLVPIGKQTRGYIDEDSRCTLRPAFDRNAGGVDVKDTDPSNACYLVEGGSRHSERV